MKEIPINSRGGIVGYATVDDEDYNRVKHLSWHLGTKGYVMHTISSGHGRKHRVIKSIRLHRVIMNAKPGEVVDHRDGHPWHNTKENLRICSARQNAMNCFTRRGQTSRYHGVYFKQKTRKKEYWVATVYPKKRKQVQIYFDTEHQAAIAHTLWAMDIYGEFANPDFDVVGYTKKKPAA